MRARRKRTQGGFTLIELMVSLVLFSFAIAGVLAIAVSMAQGYREQRQIVQTEGTARGALEFVADAIRMTSPAVSNADVALSVASPAAGEPHIIIGDIEDTETDDTTTSKCELGAIRVYNNFNNGTDAMEIVYASGGAVTSVSTGGYVAGTATLPLTDITNIADGDFLLVTNGTKGHIVRVIGAPVTGTPNTVPVATGACVLNNATAYAQGDLVVRVLRARFYVGTFDGITNLVLLMDPDGEATTHSPEPLADYVEDFQIAVGVDENTNNSIDTTEWGFSMGGPTSFTAARDLRALRITLVARAVSALPGTTATYRRPEVEDHVQATTMDTFRRRILTTTVDVRNLGGSP